jgi:hypothetical protein
MMHMTVIMTMHYRASIGLRRDCFCTIRRSLGICCRLLDFAR